MAGVGKMSAEVERARKETRNKIHAKIFMKLHHEVSESDLRAMKEYLKMRGFMSQAEAELATDVFYIWGTMNRCGMISPMKYTKLKKMLTRLHLENLAQYVSELEEEFEGDKEDEDDCHDNSCLLDMTDCQFTERNPNHAGQETNPTRGQCCTLCHYSNKTAKGRRECAECEGLTLCADCSTQHEITFHHWTVPLRTINELCKSHTDRPRPLRYRCTECNKFICDVCVILDHSNHCTFKVNAVGKEALVQIVKTAEQMRFLLPGVSQSEAGGMLDEISGMGTELVKDILLLYENQGKSSTRQRDDLVHAIQTAIGADFSEIVNALDKKAETTSSSALAKQLLSEKRAQFPLHVDFTKPEDISMGRLCQPDGADYLGCAGMLESATQNPPMYSERSDSGRARGGHRTDGVVETRALDNGGKTRASSADEKPETPLQVLRRNNSRGDSDAVRVRVKRQSSTKTRAIPSMNLYRGINGYELEDCGRTSWGFLPKFQYAFSLALLSDTRQAFLTSESPDPMRDLADTIIIFNSDGSSQNIITEKVQGSRRMIVNEEGQIVLLQDNPPRIRTFLGPEGENEQDVIDIPELQDPTSIDVDEEDNYYIIHNVQTAAMLSVVDDSGSLVTSIPMGDHRYVNYAGNNFIFTLSRTSISSYEWRGDKLCLNKTGKHDVEDFEICSSCCNGFGDLFMVGWMVKTEPPREICLYQLLEEDDRWKMLRLDSGSPMKCHQEPRISYWNGHILLASNDSMGSCSSRRFKLNTIRRKSITVYDQNMLSKAVEGAH